MSEFFDPSKEVCKHGKRLPHWQQGEVMQFVTFRLGDSMPEAKLRKWSQERKVWLGHHPKPWEDATEKAYHERFTREMEDGLDAGYGSCLLRSKEYRKQLEAVLLYDEGVMVEHHAWVIMPNHVHLLFRPMAPIADLLRKWKGISARKIGQGGIWQRGYRDTLVRDGRHFMNAVRYIRRNPLKLKAGDFTLWESERAKNV
ncbi:transposase [Haloferula rosea]|uniref:Transposase n=1 Tax=Haloferula rosea TaxID=490093 RepID=A0A934VEU5_9BACT|nr:transposase [Haloferula rosea]MBK1826396.1 transposase [Haloferula rosea]